MSFMTATTVLAKSIYLNTKGGLRYHQTRCLRCVNGTDNTCQILFQHQATRLRFGLPFDNESIAFR